MNVSGVIVAKYFRGGVKSKQNFTVYMIALTFASHLPPDLVSITLRNKTAGNMNEIRHPMVDPFIPRINSTVTKHKK